MTLSRRMFALGTLALSGCSLIQTGPPRDAYALQPVSIPDQGGRTSRSLLVVLPTAPAAIASERILIRQNALSVTYLPDARWSEEVPEMLQSVLIRTLASAGRIGFVGAQGAGPVPDQVLLTRIDAFEVTRAPTGPLQAQISFELTLLRDRDQQVLASRRFAQTLPVANDQAATIVFVLQTVLDTLLPDAAAWVLSRAG